MADANQQMMANMMQMQMQMQMAAFMAAQSAGPSDGDASLRLLGRAAAKAPASKPAAIADGPCTPEPAAASASASASLSPMNFLAPQSAMPGMPVVNPFDMMSALMRARTDGAGGAAPPLEDGEADGADPPEPEPTARRRRTGGTAKGRAKSGPARSSVVQLQGQVDLHGNRLSARNPMLKAGAPKKLSYNDNVAEAGEKLYIDWGTSSFLDTRKDFWVKYEKHAKDCGGRRAWVVRKNSSTLSEEDQAVASALGTYEIILATIAEMQEIWGQYQSDFDDEACLPAITGILETLSKNTVIKHIWQNARWMPPWQLESLQRMKLSYAYGEDPLEMRNVLLLLGPDPCKKICPDEIVRKLPTEYPSYLPAQAKKTELLAAHWVPHKSQRRLYRHSLRQAIHVAKDEATLRALLLKHFLPIFPALGKLQSDVAAGPSAAKKQKLPDHHQIGVATAEGTQDENTEAGAAVEKHEQTTQMPQETPVDAASLFGGFDIDFRNFDLANGPGAQQKIENVSPLMSTHLEEEARHVCALLWPDEHLPYLSAAIAAADEDAEGWLNALKDSKTFRNIVEAAKKFHGDIKAFDQYRSENVHAIEEFEAFCACTEKAFKASTESNDVQAVLTWNTDHSRGRMTALKLMMSMLEKIQDEFPMRVQGEHHERFKGLADLAVVTIARILKMMKICAIQSLILAKDAQPNIRETIMSNARKVAKESVALLLDMWIFDNRFVPIVAIEGQDEPKPTSLKDRIVIFQGFMDTLFAVSENHYENFIDFVDAGELAEAPSDDLQHKFRTSVNSMKEINESVSPTGAMAWSQKPDWWPCSSASVGTTFLAEGDVKLLTIVKAQHEASYSPADSRGMIVRMFFPCPVCFSLGCVRGSGPRSLL